MQSKLRVVIEDIFVVIVGALGSVLVGMIWYGTQVYHWRSAEFQFLSFGLASSALAAFCWRSGLLIALLYVLPFASVCSIPARKLFWFGFINAALFFGFAAFSFDRIWDSLHRRLPFGKFLVLGILFAVFELCKTPMLALAYGATNVLEQTVLNSLLRGMMGIGLGLGLEVAEFLVATYSGSASE